MIHFVRMEFKSLPDKHLNIWLWELAMGIFFFYHYALTFYRQNN